MIAHGINWNNQKIKKKTPLNGLSFVITGSLEKMTREKSKEILISLGGKVVASVSRNTDYLIYGNNPGSKYKMATELNVKKIDEKSFLKMIEKENVKF